MEEKSTFWKIFELFFDVEYDDNNGGGHREKVKEDRAKEYKFGKTKTTKRKSKLASFYRN